MNLPYLADNPHETTPSNPLHIANLALYPSPLPQPLYLPQASTLAPLPTEIPFYIPSTKPPTSHALLSPLSCLPKATFILRYIVKTVNLLRLIASLDGV
jgi:hypothetical protein